MLVRLDLPPIELHPNARAGWQARHRVRSSYRKAAAAAAFADAAAAGHPQWRRVSLRLHFVFGPPKRGGQRKPHDPDNLIAWAKPAIDALTDGKVIADDREVVYLPPWQSLDRDGPPCLEITVEPLE